MSTLNILNAPETHLRTLRGYVNALDADLLRAAEILRVNEAHLTSQPFTAKALKTFKNRLDSLYTKL